MNATATQKNRNSRARRQDWHPADIKAALAKKGFTFARLARENGYGENSLNMVLFKPWSQAEEIVARIIGVRPEVIWPTRYAHGLPLKSRTARILRTQTKTAAQ
jgi:Ner family transcriptional regulator